MSWSRIPALNSLDATRWNEALKQEGETTTFIRTRRRSSHEVHTTGAAGQHSRYELIDKAKTRKKKENQTQWVSHTGPARLPPHGHAAARQPDFFQIPTRRPNKVLPFRCRERSSLVHRSLPGDLLPVPPYISRLHYKLCVPR